MKFGTADPKEKDKWPLRKLLPIMRSDLVSRMLEAKRRNLVANVAKVIQLDAIQLPGQAESSRL
jgi:hypothetical protein